jgi:hypothetical protein
VQKIYFFNLLFNKNPIAAIIIAIKQKGVEKGAKKTTKVANPISFLSKK